MSITDILMSLTMNASMILLMISISVIGIANTVALLPMLKIEGNAKC